MNDEERFTFDLTGYHILRGGLSAEQCDTLLAAVHRLNEADFDDSWKEQVPEGLRERTAPTKQVWMNGSEESSVRLNGLFRLSPVFDLLVGYSPVMEVVRGVMRQPQMINAWSIAKLTPGPSVAWHNGLKVWDYWSDGETIRSRMVNTVYCLTDNGLEDGCMACIPGSHKVAKRFPNDQYPNLDMPGSVPIPMEKGDILIFSEGLAHCGLAKTNRRERTNLYINYVEALYNVCMLEPHNARHFIMPESVRDRWNPEQAAVTQWMDFARAGDVPLE